MRIGWIELDNVRGWETLRLELEPGVTSFVGPNASGKTTILEAAWYVAALQSHRSSVDEHLISKGAAAAVIRAAIASGDGDRAQRVELEIRSTGRARANLGGAPVAKRRDVLGVLRSAIFSPERMAVVRGEPSDRRKFIDDVLVQLAPRYHAALRDYEKAVRQRNALLRDIVAGRTDPRSLEAWDEAIAMPGGQVAEGRATTIAALRPEAARAYAAVGESDELTLEYVTKTPGLSESATSSEWSEAIRSTLASRRKEELVRGTTLVGPHRDEIAIHIGGLPARTHSSQGEAWMGALALVLGSYAAISNRIHEAPVLLLDDAFNPLDSARRERLADALPRNAQVLVTAADGDEIPKSLHAAIVSVSKGAVG
ncbi:MAG: DNA replication/repair protein RecF [Actinomycetota bacterium]